MTDYGNGMITKDVNVAARLGVHTRSTFWAIHIKIDTMVIERTLITIWSTVIILLIIKERVNDSDGDGEETFACEEIDHGGGISSLNIGDRGSRRNGGSFFGCSRIFACSLHGRVWISGSSGLTASVGQVFPGLLIPTAIASIIGSRTVN